MRRYNVVIVLETALNEVFLINIVTFQAFLINVSQCE